MVQEPTCTHAHVYRLLGASFLRNKTPINVKLNQRGRPRGDVGHLIAFCIPTLENMTKSLGPRVGHFTVPVRMTDSEKFEY